jgi:LEA14-like dessication related protein
MTRTLGSLLLVLLACTGCQSLKPPTVAVDGASVGAIDADGFTLDVKLNVTNPNDRDVPVGKSTYKLALAGTNVASGSAKPDVTIPANGTAPVTLPITVKFDDLLNLGTAIIRDPSRLRYDVDANVKIGGGFASASQGFSHRGDVDITQIDPVALLKNRSLRKLGESLLRGLTEE